MPIVESLMFDDLRGRTKTVEFVHATDEQLLSGFQTTVITGQNGSSKSTLLKELVGGLVLNDDSPRRIKLKGDTYGPTHVICCSGAVADRFPDKERGGRPTKYDLPNYAYLGQRVGPNLLSKKQPLETMLAAVLDPAVKNRFDWNFFSVAHQLAGITTTTSYEFHTLHRKYNLSELYDDVCRLAQPSTTDVEKFGIKSQISVQKSLKPVSLSRETAVWLLELFPHDSFLELEQELLNNKKVTMSLTSSGPRCKYLSNEATRLGLLTDVLSLRSAEVEAEEGDIPFSIYELSSGEFHMFTSILSLGFGIQPSSVVLVDEPETSLHPQWQKDFMDSLSEICSNVLKDGHLIVSTHSPLIVAAVPSGSSVLDLSLDKPLVTSVPFGASSDELLLSQFGIGSSRNRLVVDAMQRAVSLAERGGFETKEFIAMLPELKAIRAALRENDPLSDVIDALVGDERDKA